MRRSPGALLAAWARAPAPRAPQSARPVSPPLCWYTRCGAALLPHGVPAQRQSALGQHRARGDAIGKTAQQGSKRPAAARIQAAYERARRHSSTARSQLGSTICRGLIKGLLSDLAVSNLPQGSRTALHLLSWASLADTPCGAWPARQERAPARARLRRTCWSTGARCPRTACGRSYSCARPARAGSATVPAAPASVRASSS